MEPTSTPWQDVELPKFGKLKRAIECDVLVIGGGITGLTAAYLIKKSGKTVCLVERGRLGHGDTGCTTAHLTQVIELRLPDLVSRFGKDVARLVWEGGAAAINTIEEIVRQEQIDCDFQRVPGFLHAALEGKRDEIDSLKAEANLARELGFEAAFVPNAFVVNRPGVRYPNQAKFQPMAYLKGLAQAVDGGGSHIFEETEAGEFRADPHGVKANGHWVTAPRIVVATHVPIVGENSLVSASLFQTKLASYSTYAIGAKLPTISHPAASFWDTSDPYYYLRIDNRHGGDYAIFGGMDHKTGQAQDQAARFGKLESVLRDLLPGSEVDARWSAQVVNTPDGLPYIGEMAEHQFTATGFAGNGMTLGTLAAMMACDWTAGTTNPWAEVFRIDRTHFIRGAWDFVKENLSFPYYLVRDRFVSGAAEKFDDIQKDEGKLVQCQGHLVAAYRDEKGKLSTVSATCTHMGCYVRFNGAERTWDCPCHGSRFNPDGSVMAGPAESPLETFDPAAPAKS